jgi:hypothetical protein
MRHLLLCLRQRIQNNPADPDKSPILHLVYEELSRLSRSDFLEIVEEVLYNHIFSIERARAEAQNVTFSKTGIFQWTTRSQVSDREYMAVCIPLAKVLVSSPKSELRLQRRRLRREEVAFYKRRPDERHSDEDNNKNRTPKHTELYRTEWRRPAFLLITCSHNHWTFT